MNFKRIKNYLSNAVNNKITKVEYSFMFITFFTIALCLSYLPVKAESSNSSCRYTDSLALVAVHNGLSENTGWDITKPMDTWRGIRLNENGCVGSIYMAEYDLNGILVSEIGNLSEITTINFAENNLIGKIPASIGNLTNLKSINLEDNNLRDKIPASIGDLTNLINLHLGQNNLNGPIPPSIGNLSKLENLNLTNNNLNDVPESIDELRQLKRIYLGGNDINYLPSSLGYLPKLVTLSADRNNLTYIPSSFSNLSNLTNLYLDNNKLTSLPSAFSALNKLVILEINDNQLSTFPSSIRNLSKLSRLDIYNNQITGKMPPWLSSLTKLTNLKMYNNQLSGCFDNGLTILCDQLSTFSSNNTNISNSNNFDAPWEDFCSSLTGACESPCRYTDSLALVTIHNGLGEGTGWDFEKPMSSWKGITLNANGCVDAIKMDEKNLTGILLEEIGELREITSIDLEENNIFGYIPTSIGKLTNLRKLNLADNKFRGNIPSSIGSLINLTTLDLGRNKLDGLVPLKIGNLINLENLNLSDNNLTNIPSTISNLDKLTSFFLQNNKINGSMPAWLGDLNNLERLKMNNNQFSGCYDNGLVTLCNQISIWSSNTSISNNNNFNISWEDFCNGITCTDTGTKLAYNPAIKIYNYPNPFASQTTISYTLLEESEVTFTVYDGMSKKVALFQEHKTKEAGVHSINFDGSTYPPGIYYYSLQAGNYIEIQKMILIR